MFVDPNDKKTGSAEELVTKYTASYALRFLAMLLDAIDADRDGPSVQVHVVGDMTGSVKVPHNLQDLNGKAIKPRRWELIGFQGADTVLITAVDEKDVTVKINNKGEATFRLSL